MKLNFQTLTLMIVFLQIALFGIIFINADFFILRRLIGLICLTFSPGLLLMIALKIEYTDFTKYTIYAVGLSTSFLMFFGYFANIIFRLAGISQPFSEKPIIIALTSIMILISVYILLTDADIKNKYIYFSVNHFYIFLFILPILSISGAYYLNYHNKNVLLLLMFFMISAIPLLVFLTKKTKNSLLLWIISISLLYSVALSSKYLSDQSDSLLEYYFANYVLINGYWNTAFAAPVNDMLRIVILHPLYSMILNVSLIDTFKWIHPFVYSFTPVALYSTYKNFFNEKISFISSIFFMYTFLFYVTLSKNTRNGIAEFFIVLFLMSLFDKNLNNVTRNVLLIAFSASIVVSHYATSYAFMISLVIYIFFIKIVDLAAPRKQIALGPIFIILVMVLNFGWYTFSTSGSSLYAFAQFGNHLLDSLADFSIDSYSYTSYSLVHEWSFSISVLKYFVFFSYGLITLSIALLAISAFRKKLKLNKDYFALSVAFYLLFLATLLPSQGLGSSRIYHLSLCVLAPYIIIGAIKGSRILKITSRFPVIFLSIFVMASLLFDSGFMAELLIKGDDYGPNVIISKPRYEAISDMEYIKQFSENYFSDFDIASAQWLTYRKENFAFLYIDKPGIFAAILGPSSIYKMYKFSYTGSIENGSYIYLYTYNVDKKISLRRSNNTLDYPLLSCHGIYNNGGSKIYLYMR